MEAVSTFLDMGGYAATVWPAYGVTAVILVGLLVASLRALSRRKAELAALESQMERPRR
ncbi:MAG: heme exporter protein CcmD [Proteobacteria bacterium]|jgi:heme exporter protein D|nr:heme exporter protein CcmD [Pseudomonadota bacterium]MDA1070113.1 heme exporter protein CcmD [Pseudomonadota bacterium]